MTLKIFYFKRQYQCYGPTEVAVISHDETSARRHLQTYDDWEFEGSSDIRDGWKMEKRE